MKRMLPSLGLVFILSLSVLLTAGYSPAIKAQDIEFPHVEASKSITPSQVTKDGDARITINLRGAGGMVQTPVDVMLIIDRSGSMTGKKIRDAKAAAVIFLDFMNPDDRSGLVSYSSSITTLNLTLMTTENKDELIDEIDDIRAQGATNIFGAIEKANDMLLASPRSGVPLIEVLLTDGKHNFPTELPDSDFEALAVESKNKGIIIYTVGLGLDVNQERLQLIAETTGGEYFFAASSEDLEGIYTEIGSKLSFAGTNITVTETIPTYLTYNGDASHSPEESSDSSGTILKWNAGTLKVDETWEVTYTAKATRAVEVNPSEILAKVEYITAESASAIINLPPGYRYHDVAIINFTVAPPKVTEGELANVTVEIENQGIVSDNFELRTDVNGTIIDSRNLNIGSGDRVTVLLRWNTTDVEPGRYFVTVNADPNNQIWETNKTDNTVTGEIEVERAAGDIWWIIIVLLLVLLIVGAGVGYGFTKVIRRPAPAATVVQRCPRCGGLLEYSRTSRRWYCPRCRRYHDLRTDRKRLPPKPKGKPSYLTRRYPLPRRR